MYLTRNQQQWLSRSCFGLSVLLSAMGIPLAILNPQITSNQQLSTVYESGRHGDAIALPPSKFSFYLGLYMTVGAMGTAAIGASVSDPNPKRLAVVKPISDHSSRRDVIAELRQGIGSTIAANPWLMQLLPRGKLGTCVILVGSSGSGKSGLASAIALLRALLSGHEVVILDPHSVVNRQYNVWLTGTVYGQKEIKAVLPKLLEPRGPGQKPLTLIIDEFSGWNKASGLNDEAHCLVDHGIRNVRKYGHHLIFASHGKEKGLFAGEDLPSGQQGALFLQSHIVEMDASTNHWGETVWTGKARFKPSKVDPGVDALWSPIQVPASLKPELLREQLGSALAYLGMDCFYASDDAFRLPPEMEANLKKAIDASSPEFRTLLEQMFNLEVEPPDDYPDAVSSDIDTSGLSKLHLKIVQYSLEHGWVTASKIKSSVWAARKLSVDDIRLEFIAIHNQGIGQLKNSGEGLEFSARSPVDS